MKISIKKAIRILNYHNITWEQFTTQESWSGVIGSQSNGLVSLELIRVYLGY